MNANFLLVLSLAGVVCAQAEFENSHLDRLSPKAREFVEKYKAEKAHNKIKAQQKKVVLKNDVLGRKIKKGQLQDSTVYIIKDEAEPRMEVTVTDLTVEDVDIEPLGPAQYSYNDKTKEEQFWLNGKKIDKKTFFKKTEDWENRRAKKQKPLRSPYKAYLTPSEIESKLLSSKDIYIDTDEPTETANFATYTSGNYSTYLATYEEALTISQLNYAFAYGDKGKDIGIYYMDQGCADGRYIPFSSLHKAMECNRKNQAHATYVTQLLQHYAPEAFIYGYDSKNIYKKGGPDNPTLSFSPKIYIGSISTGLGDGKKFTKNYESTDAALDNYIYETGVMTFVNAGNFNPDLQSERTIHSPGKAANAITVGAYNPYPFFINGVATYIYEPYSNYINANVGASYSEKKNRKPEIMNLGNFTFSNIDVTDCIYCGTSYSTPFTAAMAADLLTRHPFFQGHPEMIKPVFLTATLGNTYNDIDTDGGAVPGVPTYAIMALNKTYSGYWPKAKEQTLFKDANGNKKELNMTISGVVAGEKYKLAISWLMKGSTIKILKKLPVNLGLIVDQDGKTLSGIIPTNFDHQYLLTSFTVPKSGSIKIRIICYSNDAPDDAIGVGYHMALQP